MVRKLLTFDSAKRISAADALQHPWIKKQASHDKVEKGIATKALSNLRNFRVRYKTYSSHIGRLETEASDTRLYSQSADRSRRERVFGEDFPILGQKW